MRVALPTLLLLAYASAASAQSLGDAARKEKKRRQENQRSGATVRVITDAEVRRGPAVVSRPGTEADADGNANGAATAPVMTPGAPAPNFSLPDRSGRTFFL